MNNDTNKNETFVANRPHPVVPFIIGAIVGAACVGVVWMIIGGSAVQEFVNEDVQQEDRTAIALLAGDTAGVPTRAAHGESVTISNQAAGEFVLVEEVVLAEPSWIAVRTADGARILGAVRRDVGAKDIVVPLLASTEVGERYEVVLFVDDGDRAFDHTKDVLVRGVFTTFVAN